MTIHPTAIIDPGAELHESVTVGPYTIIEKGVRIGPHTEIKSHCLISGPSSIGAGNVIGPFATIGAPPQDLKYKGEDSTLVVGDNNQIREYVSIHRGTAADRNETTVGSNNLLMGYVHIAHDCVVGNHAILANAATLAGHVTIHDRAILGGMVAVHQFTRIGEHSYIGGMSGISLDVPPFIIVSGTRKETRVSGINKVGLKRCGYDNETIRLLDKAFRIIFLTSGLLLKEALEKTLEEIPNCEPVTRLVDFFRTSKQGVVRTTNDKE
ncbi:MAG: acyl-[acyl-carrier-protein]--UDP-N-acetylglucosamine O-acyltransferase [Deltaproteobacteria bacterium RIFOXYD12_FULL_57_12]|nr:MAG: acyl-[acyl-carrier-protein]--UDP-N-acetylglucosamine O-acyltransferase [Deltaproteobacteria bacterium RIFOXYD12_FULL_57_12]